MPFGSIGILLLPKEPLVYSKFWIYSRTDFRLLYFYDTEFEDFLMSSGHIIVKDSDHKFRLLDFKWSEKEKSLTLPSKIDIFEREVDWVHFTYPLVIPLTKKGIIDGKIVSLNSKSSFELPMNLDKPGKLVFKYTNKTYFIMMYIDDRNSYIKELWIYKDYKFEKPATIIPCIDYDRIYIFNFMIFIFGQNGSKSHIITIYNLESGEKNEFDNPDLDISQITPTYLVSSDFLDRHSIYLWDENYTKIIEIDSATDVFCTKRLKCFSSVFPFYIFYQEAVGRNPVVKIFSKKYKKQIFVLELKGSIGPVIGDGCSRIYSKYDDKDLNHYLFVIDFNC